MKKKNYLRISIFSLLGALAGYAYYYFIGCKSGTCPITSNWEISTLYGLIAGIIIGLPSNKKKE